MGQCLNRKIDKIETMKQEVNAWQQDRNNKEATIKWQFTNDKARIKLKRLYHTSTVMYGFSCRHKNKLYSWLPAFMIGSGPIFQGLFIV